MLKINCLASCFQKMKMLYKPSLILYNNNYYAEHIMRLEFSYLFNIISYMYLSINRNIFVQLHVNCYEFRKINE